MCCTTTDRYFGTLVGARCRCADHTGLVAGLLWTHADLIGRKVYALVTQTTDIRGYLGQYTTFAANTYY